MLRYLFPRELKVSVKSYAFLVNINNEMWKRYKEEIEFDFSATKIIYTNHLAMIIYIVQKIIVFRSGKKAPGACRSFKTVILHQYPDSPVK